MRVPMAILTLTLALAASGCANLLEPVRPSLSAVPQALAPSLVRLGAGWSAQPLAQDLATAYQGLHPDVHIEMVAADSARVEELLEAGQVDVALVERSLKGEELAGWDAPPLGEQDIPLAVDALALVVHPSQPLTQIARQELAALYAGDRTDWVALGGNAGQPQPVSRMEGNLARALFQCEILAERELADVALLLPHDAAVVEYVATHPQAIGYVSRVAVDERVQVISLDGMLPTAQTAPTGNYPLAYRLVLRLRPDASPEATRLAELARSARGRRIVAERYLPVR